ncbi:MAG: TlpA disulfide reductase family protein [bacterium]
MIKKLFFVLQASVILVFCACNQSNENSASKRGFSLVNLDGATVHSEELLATVTLVDFWATWCKPCIQEIPKYNALAEKYADGSFKILGITVDSGELENIKPFVSKYDIRYPVFLGNEEVKAHFGGIQVYPTTFLLDKDGKIRRTYYGSPPGKIAEIEEMVEEILGGL